MRLSYPFTRRRKGAPGSEVRMLSSENWILWALLSAVFAALTAIFAKIGLCHGSIRFDQHGRKPCLCYVEITISRLR